MNDERDILRDVTMRPYLSGKGPTFRLITWDTHREDTSRSRVLGGCAYIGYQLIQIDETPTPCAITLFEGEDFSPGPMVSIDGDESLRHLLGFLTIREGDVEDDFFENYTPRQLDFSREHAENVGMWATDPEPGYELCNVFENTDGSKDEEE